MTTTDKGSGSVPPDDATTTAADKRYPHGFRVYSAGRWIDDYSRYADAVTAAGRWGNAHVVGLYSNNLPGRQVWPVTR